MKLNERLFELRRKAGLSQEELADKIGVSRQAVGKWENGASVPELDKLLSLSDFYQLSIGELLGVEAPAQTAAEAPAGLLALYTDTGRELASAALVTCVNGGEVGRLALDLGDAGRWYQRFPMPEKYPNRGLHTTEGEAVAVPRRWAETGRGSLYRS